MGFVDVDITGPRPALQVNIGVRGGCESSLLKELHSREAKYPNFRLPIFNCALNKLVVVVV